MRDGSHPSLDGFGATSQEGHLPLAAMSDHTRWRGPDVTGYCCRWSHPLQRYRLPTQPTF